MLGDSFSALGFGNPRSLVGIFGLRVGPALEGNFVSVDEWQSGGRNQHIAGVSGFTCTVRTSKEMQ